MARYNWLGPQLSRAVRMCIQGLDLEMPAQTVPEHLYTIPCSQPFRHTRHTVAQQLYIIYEESSFSNTIYPIDG